jgi:hypothetical protein
MLFCQFAKSQSVRDISNGLNSATLNKEAYYIQLLKGSDVVADRYYNDFSLLNIWDSNQVFIVNRHKENLQFISV